MYVYVYVYVYAYVLYMYMYLCLYLCVYVAISIRYEDMQGDYKIWKMGWFAVVMVHSRSLEIAPFDRAHTSSVPVSLLQ